MLYWFLDLEDLVKVNRALLYKDLKVLVLQANGELAQMGACMAGMCPGFNPTGGNILLLDFYSLVIL